MKCFLFINLQKCCIDAFLILHFIMQGVLWPNDCQSRQLPLSHSSSCSSTFYCLFHSLCLNVLFCLYMIFWISCEVYQFLLTVCSTVRLFPLDSEANKEQGMLWRVSDWCILKCCVSFVCSSCHLLLSHRTCKHVNYKVQVLHVFSHFDFITWSLHINFL